VEDQQTKICPVCAETVKAVAKKCPFCRADLRSSVIRIDPAPWFSWVFMLLFFCGALIVFYRVAYPGRDFSLCRNQIVVSSSSMQFSAGERGRYVTTVGTINNESDYGWKEVQLEVRYFNRNAKLIDVGVQIFPDIIIQPHSESAFRVRTLADQPESAYASHKVFVRTAKDIRRWP
jgi:hypothetical protein